MLTLIKREIADAAIFFLIAAIFASIAIGMLVYRTAMETSGYQDMRIPLLAYESILPFPYYFFLPLIAASLGNMQTNIDRNKKISSFLATLSTTRRQIMAAKIITGILWISLPLFPVALAHVILFRLFPEVTLPSFEFLVVHIFVTIFLCCLACYSIGLLSGCVPGKLIPTFGTVLAILVLTSLIVIKGSGLETNILFALFALTAIIRTWQKFMSSSL